MTRFHGEPAGCQVVIVILWSRLGTHLDVSHDRKPDNTPFLSGTEWEYLNAFNASPRPEILVYRRTDPAMADLKGLDLDEKRRQYQLVEQFFQQFSNPDGSARGSYQPYQGVESFKQHLAADLERIAAEHLKRHRRDAPSPDTASPATPEPTPVLPPARCLGRTDEADELIAALAAPGTASLLVLGPAGIGKTTLTRRVATEPAVTARFGPRRFFVSLETATDAATLRTAIIQAIGLSPASTSFAAALAVLSEHPALLVLDNLETPWEPDQPAAQDVLLALSSAPNVSLLASLRGHTAPASPGWTLPPTRLGALAEADARRLFLAFAPEAEKDPVHLAYFLAALGGVPLAVELVALRAGADTNLAELWAEWGRRRIALAEHPDQDPGRLTSLGRSLDLSWNSRRLREPGRRLFRLLGALPAGIADSDRLSLLGEDATEAARQVSTVGLAFRRGGRLDLLPPVRDYARVARPPEGAEAAVWCLHYLTLARDTGGQLFEANGATALARLAPEVANIEAALAGAGVAKVRSEAVAALNGIARLLSASGAGSLAPLNVLAEACRTAGEVKNEAECHYRLGYVAIERSDLVQAGHALEQARLLFNRSGSARDEAYCILSLGNVALQRSEYDDARTAYEQALPLFHQVKDLNGEAECIERLGDIALRHSDHDAARTAYEQAQPLYHEIGDIVGEANCIQSLGDIALDCSEYETARAAYERALLLFSQAGVGMGEGNCHSGLGHLARVLGDLDTARARFRRALSLYQRVQVINNVAAAHQDLARVTAGAERAEHIQAARAAWTAIGLPDQVARLDREFG